MSCHFGKLWGGKIIPKQLHNSGFRFVKIRKGEKRPFELEWTTKRNYQYNNPALLQHIDEGGNYGVLCGCGDLVALDADNPKLKTELNGKLPETFQVKTGGGGTHDYYLVKDIKKHVLEKDGEHLGELQSTGTQVVGANSTHPNGLKYMVTKDIDIAVVSKEDMLDAIKPLCKTNSNSNAPAPFEHQDINLMDVIDTSGLKRQGNEYQGAHPLHGSTTGTNFNLNTTKDTWHCFRCNSGGGALEWIALEAGLINCADAKRGCLRGELFKQALQIAKEKYDYKPIEQEGLLTPTKPFFEGTKTEKREQEAVWKKTESIKLVNNIKKEFHIKTIIETEPRAHMYFYDEGVYAPKAEGLIQKQIRDRFGSDITRHEVAELIGHLKGITYVSEKVFDEDKELICCENGLLNVITGELIPHDPTTLTRTKVPVVFDADANCTRWEKFLDEVLIPNGKEQTNESRNKKLFLQEMFGYCLLRDYPYAKSTMLTGAGRNGKSVVLDTLQELLGVNNVSTVPLQNLDAKEYALGALVGKLANVAADLGDKALNSTSAFKSILGGDRVHVNRKYLEPTDEFIYAKLLFSANRVPKTSDNTKAFFERVVIIPFPNYFPPGVGDPNLRAQLKTELSGILNWALEGLRRLMKNENFSYAPNAEEMERQYLVYSDPVTAFVNECLEADYETVIPKAVMYKAFVEYAKIKEMPMLSNNAFGRAILESTEKQISTEHRTIKGKKGVSCYRGYKPVGYVQGIGDIEDIADFPFLFLSISSTPDTSQQRRDIPYNPNIPNTQSVNSGEVYKEDILEHIPGKNIGEGDVQYTHTTKKLPQPLHRKIRAFMLENDGDVVGRDETFIAEELGADEVDVLNALKEMSHNGDALELPDGLWVVKGGK